MRELDIEHLSQAIYIASLLHPTLTVVMLIPLNETKYNFLPHTFL